MPDVFTKAKRSEVMSRIRSRGNKATELALAKLLRRHGVTGWRRQVQVRIAERGTRKPAAVRAAGNSFRTPHSAFRVLAVRVDFVFRPARLALFVDGCFWHGCPKHATQPKNNRVFWRRKFARNQERDELVNRTLRKSGWRVLRIWECALHRAAWSKAVEARLVRRIQRAKNFHR